MNIKLFSAILFGIFLVNFVSSLNISLYPNPGLSEADSFIQYSFNFTSSTNCNPANNLLSYTKIVHINNNGVGYVSLDISNLTQIPTRLCEGKDGVLRANHSYADIIVNTIYAKYLNLSGDAIIKGRLKVNGTTLFVNTNGNVGIGTINPKNKLNVIGNGNFTGTIYQNGVVVAGIGNCPSGQFVQNTTTGGVQCSAAAGSGDITSIQGDLYIVNGSDNGNVQLVFNTTYAGSNLNINRSNYWDNYNTPSGFLWIAGFNATGDTRWALTSSLSSYYLKSNPFSFVNISTASNLNYRILSYWLNITNRPTYLSNFTNDLSFLTEEHDPKWSANISSYYTKALDPWSANYSSYYTKTNINSIFGYYYNKTQINNLGYYNSSDFSISDYYLKSNPFGFYNSSSFSISNYYTKTQVDNNLTTRFYSRIQINTLGYYNSSTAYTKAQVDNNLTTRYYLLSNPNKYWNSTFALFNKTYADALYSTKAEPLWSGNLTLVYLKSNPFGFYNTSTLVEHDPKWSANISSYYTKTLDPWSANRTSYYTKTQTDNNLTTRYYLKSNPAKYWNATFATFNKTYADTLYSTKAEPLWSGNRTLLVPYTGASANVVLGARNLTTTEILKGVYSNATYGNFSYAKINKNLYATYGNFTDIKATTAFLTYGNFTSIKLTGTGYLVNISATSGIKTTSSIFGNKLNITYGNFSEIKVSKNVIGTYGNFTSIKATGNVFLATSSGNVGIGTTAPGAKLELSDGTNGTRLAIGTSGSLSFTTTNSAGDINIDPQRYLNFGTLTGQVDAVIMGRTDVATTPIVFKSGVETMRIINGNVGIGTNNPKNTLNVLGTLNVTNASGVGTLGLFQSILGRVGIGISSPTSKLHVIGATNTTNLIVTNVSAASCDVKAYQTTGKLYCGTDATSSGGAAFTQYNWTSTNIATTSNTTYTKVMTLPLTSGKMVNIECEFLSNTTSATAGFAYNLTVSGTSSRTFSMLAYRTAITPQHYQATTAQALLFTNTSVATNITQTKIHIYTVQSGTGKLIVKVKKSKGAGATVSIKVGSWCRSIEN